MSDRNSPIIAVVGASGQQGGGAVRALQANGEFRVRALTRNPGRRLDLGDEVIAADLNRPETLKAAFEGAYGVFLVTNFWEPGGADEIAQATAAIRAAKEAGVQHLVWSTLPDVAAISGGRYSVPHFTNKAQVDAVVSAAGFRNHTFVVPPSFYQNLVGQAAPQPQKDGSTGWALPIDPGCTVHMGDALEIGLIVAGAFARPGLAGNGQYLPLVGDHLSYGEMVATLNRQGHAYTFQQVPKEAFANFFPGAKELADSFAFIEDYTYLGGRFNDGVALANEVAGADPTDFATWARVHMAVKQAKELALAG